MKRLLLVLLLAVGVGGPLIAADVSPIVPGESAGAVKLGMTLEEVEKLWGKSTAEDATLGRRLLTWKDAGAAAPFASIFFTRIGAGHTYVVEQISVHAPKAATPTGIKIGAEIGQKKWPRMQK